MHGDARWACPHVLVVAVVCLFLGPRMEYAYTSDVMSKWTDSLAPRSLARVPVVAVVGQAGGWTLGPLGSGCGVDNGTSSGGVTNLWVLTIHTGVGSGCNMLARPVPRPVADTCRWVPIVVAVAGWVGLTSGPWTEC